MADAPLSSEPRVSPLAGRANSPSGRGLRLFWLCLGTGLLAVIILVWAFGLTWWTVLIAVLVTACPAVAAWIMLGGLDSWPKLPGTDR